MYPSYTNTAETYVSLTEMWSYFLYLYGYFTSFLNFFLSNIVALLTGRDACSVLALRREIILCPLIPVHYITLLSPAKTEKEIVN